VTITTLNSLACSLFAMGEFTRAEPHFERVWVVYEVILGPTDLARLNGRSDFGQNFERKAN